ncbi:hypothetical protein MLD38_009629 [Melastoma candidum]|uniref:Uncharacterized protein n=1 Tax=Melastoma candidum TaxID=119954 RepID=A0ACB9RXU3_9MYRT|nr:hypothetical protein MLD38_009629 [Melastoma candidum]
MENNCCSNLPPPTPYRPFFFPPPAPINPSYLPTKILDDQDNGNATPTWVIVGSVIAILIFCFFLYKFIKRSEKGSREAKPAAAASSKPGAAASSKPGAAASSSTAIVPAQPTAGKKEPGAPAMAGPSPAMRALSTGFTGCPSCGHKGGMWTLIYTCPSCNYKEEINVMYPKKK